MQEFVQLANRLADESGNIIRQYFRTPLDVERKSDDSPVTIADREVEQALREIIEKERPEDGIFGEEFGVKESQNGLTWVLDPIDGTKSFIIGRPTFGTLIALCESDTPVLGIIDQPILKERWTGIKNEQTTLNGDKIKTTPCSSLDKASIASTTPAMFSDTGPVYEKFETGCKISWGADCYAYGLLASGHCDMVIEANLSPYDFVALVPVVEGAGGKICDWDGHPLTLKSGDKVIALGDASLWDEVSKLLKYSHSY